MTQAYEEIWTEFSDEKEKAQNIKDVEAIKIKFLGKKGIVTGLLKQLGTLSVEEKKEKGAKINELKAKLTEIIEAKIKSLEAEDQEQKIRADRPDYSLPGLAMLPGATHPVLRIVREISEIFVSMGFFIADGPEVESEYYNFEALNVPSHHPARDMQDSFYLESGHVLRTQTSPVQIRTMEKIKPPFKMIAPGKVFRRDNDITHSPVFHQIEGLVVGENVSMCDLKGTLVYFAERMFGKRSFRFRPSYFPFTEPSAEMDIQCIFCSGGGCKICKGSGWIEILGCGMVNPKVFAGVNYDSEKFSGFAFGMGIERQAILRYGINDIRLLFGSDIRFLRQF
ncbi:MAG: phenylalanine--tRNA ligase subunit alpha [Candidatus Riflebacteria bacterium]|nr:phenylalanine--tRNA ligase subunit alpha [Candidatus Riflebacteria bacterium]